MNSTTSYGAITVEGPQHSSELQRDLGTQCGELVPIAKRKRNFRVFARICLCFAPGIAAIAALAGLNYLAIIDHSSHGVVVATATVLELMTVVIGIGVTMAVCDIAERQLPVLPTAHAVMPKAVERFIDVNRSYIDGLYARVSAYNEQLAAFTSATEMLDAEDPEGYKDAYHSMAERSAALRREVNDWNARAKAELEPYRAATNARNQLIEDCAKLKRTLEAFDGKAGAPAPTIDVTTLTLAMRTRDSLVARAAALGLPDSVVPNVSAPRLLAACH